MFDENTLETIDSFDEDDIDIFAELGVTGVRPTNNLAEQKQQQNENLAILLGNNEEDEYTADNEPVPQMNITPATEEPYGSLPDETISELLEILVKQELTVSEGKEIID